ncbi:MAG: GNAT family N-acetyltransferase [Rubrivivax sp.]|nr:GNAT family N-acetyltransferase [Rubrivivax sp.]
MSDRIVIRPERPDQPEVMDLLAELDAYLGSLYEPEANHILDVHDLLQPEIAFYVARENLPGGRAVGTAAFRRMQGEPATRGLRYGEIKRMYVDPAFRGERIGARLIAALEDGLRAEGFALALLETGSAQTEAVRLYEREGYRPRTAFGGYPDNGLSVFYEKAL